MVQRWDCLSAALHSLYAVCRNVLHLREIVDGPKKTQAARWQTNEIQSGDQKSGQAWRQNATLRKRRPRSLGSKVKGAYRTVVDTIKGTDQLRNKMELPATSETE